MMSILVVKLVNMMTSSLTRGLSCFSCHRSSRNAGCTQWVARRT